LKLNTCAGYQKKTDPIYIGNGQCESKICVENVERYGQYNTIDNWTHMWQATLYLHYKSRKMVRIYQNFH